MCRPASFIVTRTKVLYLDWCDSHEEIIEHYGLDDSPRGGDFVRVEISPGNNNFRLPYKNWEFSTDQDSTPDWYAPEEAEIAVRKMLPAWAKTHIIRTGEVTVPREWNLSVIVLGGIAHIKGQSGGGCWASGSAILNATGQTGGYCRASGSATLNATGQTGGDCWAYDSATLNATGQSGGECGAFGSATINATGQSGGECWVYDSATINRK